MILFNKLCSFQNSIFISWGVIGYNKSSESGYLDGHIINFEKSYLFSDLFQMDNILEIAWRYPV